ncbi:hypothetical protein [Chryseobacterium sp. GP-SGM7]|uniref:hypothetical protein n=1 Tax=Chryseobacterium sp. GP-SGM7 TaxID=3411323 RepID=UPI003B94C521
MENVYVRVAFCKNCGGYHSSAPENLSQINHPEIIDHYFYHGEPWFTLEESVFEIAAMKDATEIKTLHINDHQKNDQDYCFCTKKILTVTKTPFDQFSVYSNTIPATKQAVETEEFYFRDVYQLCYNFH